MKRRKFIQTMGVVSGGLMSTLGTAGTDKKIVPYLIPADGEPLPGQAVFYPTTCSECPANCGLLARVRDGVAVKLEGNPGHPVNQGALCLRGQASLARLYSPRRLNRPMVKKNGRFSPVSWQEAERIIQGALATSKREGSRNVFLRSQSTGSLQRLIGEFCRAKGIERLPEFEIFHHGSIKKANEILFGQSAVPLFRIDHSDLLITLGADILETFVNPVGYARQIAEARSNHLKWFHCEPHISQTGLAADHRLAILPGSEPSLLCHLLHSIRRKRPLPPRLMEALPRPSLARVAQSTSLSEKDISRLIQEIDGAAKPLILCGGVSTMTETGLAASLLSGLLQYTLDAVGDRVDFTRCLNAPSVGTYADLKTIESKLSTGGVGVFFLSGTLATPVLSDLIRALGEARFRIAIGNRLTPLCEACDLVLPPADPMETWGDTEPFRGWISLLQPVKKPEPTAPSEGGILLRLMGEDIPYEQYIQNRWREYGDDWRQNGFKILEPESTRGGGLGDRVQDAVPPIHEALTHPPEVGPTLIITPSPRFFDGRSRDIDLLNEIPDPVSTISYGRWVNLSKETARQHNLSRGDEAALATAAGHVQIPMLPQADHQREAMSVSIAHLTSLSPPLLADTGEMEAVLTVAEIRATGRHEHLPQLSASTQAANRGVLPGAKPHHGHGKGGILYPEPVHRLYRWAMAVDLDLCNGCAACVAACYIENNIPMTGADEHRRGREMSWLRIAPYRDGQNDPGVTHMPMLCQHCTYAPCEPVCPVYATYHNPEGLNAQVYNRCVGTRYCANNCPYKARRFNWDDEHRILPLYAAANPDVSRRPKGVMEKCTFCVQRIRAVKDKAKDENRPLADGEILPACAQTCPTGAIAFGNLLDTRSRVYELAHSPRSHRVFEALGTEPAVFYLKEKREHDR